MNFHRPPTVKRHCPGLLPIVLLAAFLVNSVSAPAAEPHIVNLYCFCRENDFRLENSEQVLFQATVEQVKLFKQAGLPATFALQYDALMDTNYQRLFKEQLTTNDEIGAWWEIPQELAEKAGLKWRGRHEWDPEANVGFSPGYTPDERRKLVDVYMVDFKSIFGFYPKTVGSWYIDEVTLDYMAKRYGVIASCNCKDQIGTDFYTLWGGYWNQAYYPSRLNAYMPAQTKSGQLSIPVFRMLGSDPIYQHGTTPGLQSLEPVYAEAGGSPKWVAWFMDNLIHQPSLAFGYTQAGQENSFGWEAMRHGLTNQVALFAKQDKAGEIRVETFEQTGRWFRKNFALTPPTSVVVMDDWKDQGRKTVWYDSRFYRMNLLWQDGSFFIRDLHCFDEHVASPTHQTALTATSLTYETLPVMDWAVWSKAGEPHAGMWPVLLSSDGTASSVRCEGQPVVKELNKQDLDIEQTLADGAKLSMVCSERKICFAGADANGQPLHWALKLVGGPRQNAIVQSVRPQVIRYRYLETDYQVKVASGSCEQLANGDLQLNPDRSGKVMLEFKR